MNAPWRRLRRLVADLGLWGRKQREIPEDLWQLTLQRYAFLAQDEHATPRLRQLTGQFLAQKEFHGAAGLVVTNQMAVAIAAQACLPLLHLHERPGGMPRGTGSALAWYGDFLGIVVQPSDVVARRETVDEAGVVHHFDEVISGEAMDQGPVMLSWPAVAQADATSGEGYNVVIHEFAHKIDMADGRADGCPALQAGFRGARSAGAARQAWIAQWQHAYETFCERLTVAERFGGEAPWLDPYGAQSLDEFFAVACEAYFVNRLKFAQEFPTLMPDLDAFFRGSASG